MAVRQGMSAAVFAATVVMARRRPIPETDGRLLQAVNRLPDGLHLVVWPVMQAGSFAAVPVSALLAARLGRGGLALRLAGTGLAAWLAAKAAKPLADRERPATYLPGVTVRGAPQSGRGFPSGHAAVSTSLLMVAASRARPAAKAAAAGLAVTVATSRIYVGAHFPLDALGGIALGYALATLAASSDRERK